MIMKVSDDKSKIVIDNLGAREADFNAFKEVVPKDKCRYSFSSKSLMLQ